MKRCHQTLIALLLTFSAVLFAQPFGELPVYQPDGNVSYADIPGIYKWDLSQLCPDIQTWEKEIKVCEKDLEKLAEMASGLDKPAGVADYLNLYFDLDERINRLTLHANLMRDSETSNPAKIANHEKGLKLTGELMGKGSLVRQVLLNWSDRQLQKAYKKAPSLKEYKPFIDSIRRRKDILLSDKEEKLLALAGDNLWAQIDLNELPATPEKIHRAMIADLDLPSVEDESGNRVNLTLANYGRYRGSDDRKVRAATVDALFSTLKSYENVFASTLAGQAEFSLFLAKSRGYNTVLEAYLDKDDLTPDVYYNLVNTVKANVAPLHRYVALRKKLMKVDEVHLYDLYTPLAPAADIHLDFNRGSQYIIDALQPLGDEYVTQLKIGMDPHNGWLDLYPSKNKDSGAFSTGVYGYHPYVKMNFMNSFNGVSTLAHEYGHALHTYLSTENQPYLLWRYVPFLAEIASTCNEALLSQYMIANAENKAQKVWLLSELIETIRTTIYRQTLFAEFELRLHEMVEAGEPVNAEKLNSVYCELVKTYYGNDYTMDVNDGIEWAYIPHFYYKYYVFTYATGLSAGIAFAEKLTNGTEADQEAYLNMLKGGASKPPLVLLQDAGVDMTQPEAIESALKLFDRTITELENLLNE